MIIAPRCAACGQVAVATYATDHFGSTLCLRCIDNDRCFVCGSVTGGTGQLQRTVLSDGRIRCGRCSASAVTGDTDLVHAVPPVREYLRSIGISLPNRVQVQLADSAEIAAKAMPGAYGYTQVIKAWRGTIVRELRILDGLPETAFGGVLAHEIGHAWLAGCPDGRRTPIDDEGICEILHAWWLEHRGGPLSAHLLESMERNPDPVYGGGYRKARQRASGLSRAQVVSRIVQRGIL